MNGQRGAVSPLALVAVLALGVLATIGITARTSNLAFEGRALGRVCARWAAEAALAEVRGSLAEGRHVEHVAGTLPPASGHKQASFTAAVSAVPNGQDVRAEGSCIASSGRATRVAIVVRFVLRAGRWEVATWAEGPPAELAELE